jgi:hypothetical protein
MKNSFKVLASTLMVFVAITFATTAFAQDPPPPPGGGHGNNNNQPPGGGAPIDGGLLILAALGGVYGVRKFVSSRRNVAE